MTINKKKGGFRGVKRKSWKEDCKIPNVINSNKIAKKRLLSENTGIVTNSSVKRVISVIEGKNQVRSDITSDKKAKPSNNKLAQKINEKIDPKLHSKGKTSTLKKNSKKIKFLNNLLVDIKNEKEAFKKGVWDKSVVIQKSLIGRTMKFNDDGMITKCRITPDKVGYKFGDFTYDNELMKGVNKKIDQKLNKKEVKNNEISPKSDNVTPRHRNRQERKPREPRKPREKREPRLKKEPWEYEGKSFLEKYNEKK